MEQKINQNNTVALIDALLNLTTKSEAKKFLRDLLTEREITEFGNRFLAARLLYKKTSYTKISKRTGLSSKTIARISKWLNSGMGGYLAIINKMHHHNPKCRKGIV